MLDLGLGGTDGLLQGLLFFGQGDGKTGVPGGLEEGLEDGLAFGGPGQHEFLEAPLGQEHHLPELIGLEADELGHLGIDLGRLLGGERNFLPILQLPEVGAVGLALGAPAPLFGDLLFG